jgi:hypothetical protein
MAKVYDENLNEIKFSPVVPILLIGTAIPIILGLIICKAIH